MRPRITKTKVAAYLLLILAVVLGVGLFVTQSRKDKGKEMKKPVAEVTAREQETEETEPAAVEEETKEEEEAVSEEEEEAEDQEDLTEDEEEAYVPQNRNLLRTRARKMIKNPLFFLIFIPFESLFHRKKTKAVMICTQNPGHIEYL